MEGGEVVGGEGLHEGGEELGVAGSDAEAAGEAGLGVGGGEAVGHGVDDVAEAEAGGAFDAGEGGDGLGEFGEVLGDEGGFEGVGGFDAELAEGGGFGLDDDDVVDGGIEDAGEGFEAFVREDGVDADAGEAVLEGGGADGADLAPEAPVDGDGAPRAGFGGGGGPRRRRTTTRRRSWPGRGRPGRRWRRRRGRGV